MKISGLLEVNPIKTVLVNSVDDRLDKHGTVLRGDC